jgi:DNA-binding winged helix-turn-helix (wHTH) protein
VSAEVAFGPFVLSVTHRRLWHQGAPVALKPKEAALLALLAERRPHPISKDEIIERLWRSGEASDAALTQTVYRLRRALGQYVGECEYIRTIPGLGFQFEELSSPIETRSATLDALRPTFGTYQRAVALYRQRSEIAVLEAIRLLESVCAEDPEFVPAWTMVARAYLTAGVRLFVERDVAFWRSRRALFEAIERDPQDDVGFSVLSALLLFFNADRELAKATAERALILAPHAASSHKAAIWERLSRRDFAAALTQADLAVRSGPASKQSISLLGMVLYMSRRYHEALSCFETALRMDSDHSVALFYEACAETMLGHYDIAKESLACVGGRDMRARVIAVQGCIAARERDASAVRRAIDALSGGPDASDVSICAVHLACGQYELAAAAIERALETREPGLFLVCVDPLYAELQRRYPSLIGAIDRGRDARCDRCAAPLARYHPQELHHPIICARCVL